METIYNIYCDESCHIEHDDIPIMVFSAIWCPTKQVKNISKEIKALKIKYNAKSELKWTKVSKSKLPFYEGLLDYFFSEDNLYFRCLIITGKDKLNHGYFNQGSHDSFYYKMYYQLLLNIITNKPDAKFNIYIDIKDTRGSRKIKKLKDVLHAKLQDAENATIRNIQLVHSYESQLIQLSDFFGGAVGYHNRNDIPKTNLAKQAVIQKMQSQLGINIAHSTPPWEEKFNLFLFQPRRI